MAGRLRVRAVYDAARTGHENRRHWAAADTLSADAALSPDIRRVLRSRSRYESANNGYLRGIVKTLATYIVGTGPRLQLLTLDADTNRFVEAEFTAWAEPVDLAAKLRTMRIAQTESGECFGLLVTNPVLCARVKLDYRLIEADRVRSPWPFPPGTGRAVDGIQLDANDNPIAYYILKRHPGDTSAFSKHAFNEFDIVAARNVVHLFEAERPEQHRGVPELTPSLSLSAMLRRFTLATLGAAEQAAIPGGVLYTDAPPQPTVGEKKSTEWDEVELERGVWLTMPQGWNVSQIKAEHPTTTYTEFKHELVDEIARPLAVPSNLARGNSSEYNYASGRLDHQSFHKAIQVYQRFLEVRVLNRLLTAWLDEASLIEGYLPQALRVRGLRLLHKWFWDGLEHVDPAKSAIADKHMSAIAGVTLAEIYGRKGLNWETEVRQWAAEQKLIQELTGATAAAKSGAGAGA